MGLEHKKPWVLFENFTDARDLIYFRGHLYVADGTNGIFSMNLNSNLEITEP